MPISTIGMICLACVGVSEAPAGITGITGLSGDAPAMVQLASVKPSYYNITNRTEKVSEVKVGTIVYVQMLPLSARAGKTTATYQEWNLAVNQLKDLFAEYDNPHVSQQVRNRINAVKWYAWAASYVPADSIQRMSHFQHLAALNFRDHGNYLEDAELKSILAKLPFIKKGHRSSRI